MKNNKYKKDEFLIVVICIKLNLKINIMKKILLAAVLFLAASASIQAQLLQIGVKAGVNFANQTGDASFDGT